MARKAKTKRRKYKRRVKDKVEAVIPYNTVVGARTDLEQPQTLTQRLHNAEQERDALKTELKQTLDAIYKRDEETAKQNRKQVNGLQNEVGMLRSMIARMTYGGIHVRDVESIAPRRTIAF